MVQVSSYSIFNLFSLTDGVVVAQPLQEEPEAWEELPKVEIIVEKDGAMIDEGG